jgi:hypothetical protein
MGLVAAAGTLPWPCGACESVATSCTTSRIAASERIGKRCEAGAASVRIVATAERIYKRCECAALAGRLVIGPVATAERIGRRCEGGRRNTELFRQARVAAAERIGKHCEAVSSH